MGGRTAKPNNRDHQQGNSGQTAAHPRKQGTRKKLSHVTPAVTLAAWLACSDRSQPLN